MDVAIAAFWNWFTTSHEDVSAAYDRADFVWMRGELTTRIRAIQPCLNWEMGPYHAPDRTLVISPSIRENVDLARRMVSAAPLLPAWHFLPAKPPKQLARLSMDLPEVGGTEVCADDWQYRLTGYNDLEFFDIEVFTDVGPIVVEKDLRQVTHRLIEAIVGESLYLERFATVTLFRASDPRPADPLTPFPLLGRHISDLLQ